MKALVALPSLSWPVEHLMDVFAQRVPLADVPDLGARVRVPLASTVSMIIVLQFGRCLTLEIAGDRQNVLDATSRASHVTGGHGHLYCPVQTPRGFQF